MFVFIWTRSCSKFEKIIKKIMKKPGAEDLKTVWELELGYPLQAVITNGF